MAIVTGDNSLDSLHSALSTIALCILMCQASMLVLLLLRRGSSYDEISELGGAGLGSGW